MSTSKSKKKAKMTVTNILEGEKVNLASKVDAPFPIYSSEELKKYFSLSQRSFMIPKHLDMETLEGVKLKGRVKELCDRLGWGKFIGLTHSVFKELTLEFYTALKLSDQAHKKFECRLNGMSKVFGFPKGGLYEPPTRYNSREFW